MKQSITASLKQTLQKLASIDITLKHIHLMNGVSIIKRVVATLLCATIIALFFTPVSALANTLNLQRLGIGEFTHQPILNEDFGFSIQAYPYEFQRRKNVIDIDITYRYHSGITKANYPNFIGIKKYIEDYIQNYPDKYQYWEILNKDLVVALQEQYPILETISIDLTIYPTTEFPLKRHSLVSIEH